MILVVMVIDSIYPILDENLFVEREKNHEIYREIHADSIFDLYEEYVMIVDFVF